LRAPRRSRFFGDATRTGLAERATINTEQAVTQREAFSE
jgi:hypothetical protein